MNTLVQQAQFQEKFQASKDLPTTIFLTINFLQSLMPNLGCGTQRFTHGQVIAPPEPLTL